MHIGRLTKSAKHGNITPKVSDIQKKRHHYPTKGRMPLFEYSKCGY